MTSWVLVRLPATSYAFRHPTLARNMQGMPRMGRLAAATSPPFPCEAREKGLKTAAPSLPGQPEDPRLWRRAPNGAAIQGVESHPDGPPRMVKRPTGSGGEPSSPNCGASAGVKARHLSFAGATLLRPMHPWPCWLSADIPLLGPPSPASLLRNRHWGDFGASSLPSSLRRPPLLPC